MSSENPNDPGNEAIRNAMYDSEGRERGDTINPAFALVFGDQESSDVHNFDGDDLRQWQLSALCKGGDVIKVDEILGQPIEVKYVYCHKVQVTGRTPGEIDDAVRTCLITPDNKVYACVSNGVASDACTMLKRFKLKPFDPPIKLAVKAVATRGGRKTWTLSPVM